MATSMLSRALRTPAVLLLMPLLLGAFTGAGCASRPVPMMRAHGNTAFAQGRYPDAIAFQQRVIELAPGRAQYQYELGRSLRANGELGRAAEHLAIAHGLEPASPVYVRAYAEALTELERVDVLEEVLMTRAQSTGSFEDYLLMGEFLGKAGDPDAQEQALLSAADLAGRADDRPQRALARFYEQANRPRQALERWKMVLWFDLDDPEATYAIRQAGDVPGPTARLVPIGRTGR